ncbi:hypothetical protein OAE88_00620 [bacterium]|nr:hypothetical protein [bacterium]
MADISIQDLGVGSGGFETGSVFDAPQRQEAEAKRTKSISDATVGEQYDAMVQQAGKVSFGASAADTVLRESIIFGMEEDKDFHIDDETTAFALEQKGVSIKNFGDIRGSKSQLEMETRLGWAKLDEDRDNNIASTLSDRQITTASVVGAIADVDLLAGGVVGIMSKSTSLMKVAKVETSVEAGLAAMHYALDEDYTAGDALLDFAVGTTIAIGATKIARNLDRSSSMKREQVDAREGIATKESGSVSDVTETIVKTTDDVKPKVDLTPEQIKKQQKKDFKDTATKTAVKEVEDASSIKVSKLEDEIADIKTKMKNKKNTATQNKRMQKMIDNRNTKIKELSETAVKKIDDVKKVNKIEETVSNVIEEDIPDLYDAVKAAGKEDLVHMKKVVDDAIEKFPEETKELVKLFNSKMKNKKSTSKKITGKQKAVIGALGLTMASSAYADDGDSSGLSLAGAFFSVVALGVVGPRAIEMMMDGRLKEIATNIPSTVSKAFHKVDVDNTKQAKTMKEAKSDLTTVLHTRFTSTIAPFQKYSDESAKFMEKLLYSYKNGGGAETMKTSWNHSAIDKFNVEEDKAFKLWLTENKTGSSWYRKMSDKLEFRRKVSDAMENRTDLDDSMQMAVKANDDLLEETYARAKEYGVLGFEHITYKKGKIPRLWKAGAMNKMLNNMSDDDVIKVRDALAEAIGKNSDKTQVKALKEADKFIKSWKAGGDGIADRTGDIYESLVKKDMLPEGMTLDDFADKMDMPKDKNARAKNRIDFDVKDIPSVTVKINGKPTVIDMDSMVERDFKVIFDKTINTINSSSALAREGIKSIEGARKRIKNLYKGSSELQKEANQILDLLVGKPLDIPNKSIHNVSLIAKDLVIVAKLPLVVFSMPPEMLYTVANTPFTKLISNGVKAISGRKNPMLNQLMSISGLGSGANRIDLTGHRGLTDSVDGVEDMDFSNALRSGTVKMRDLSMLANGLAPMSDFLQRMNLMANAEHFQNVVQGMDKYGKTRLKMFGIDDDAIAMFKGDKWDMDKWSMKKKDKFAEVMRNMNQQYTPETTLGETALGGRTSDTGRLFSALITYPMQQFNVHGLGDVDAMDKIAVMHTTLSFAGAYMGLHARYAVQGKEVEEDRITQLAMMNIPLTGILAQAKSLTNPVVMQSARDAAILVGVD